MRSRAHSLVALLVMAAMFLGTCPDRAAAQSGYFRLHHYGYYNPTANTSRYLLYATHGGAYPWYDFHPYYGFSYTHFPPPPEPIQPPSDPLAHLTVQVPADAEVSFNGTPMGATGTVREFDSPPLGAGRRYAYEVRVRWQDKGHEVSQTRKVIVSAEAHIAVAFPATAETKQ